MGCYLEELLQWCTKGQFYLEMASYLFIFSFKREGCLWNLQTIMLGVK